MRQSLFKDNSKFQKFNEIVSCEMTRFRNLKLGVFRQYQNILNFYKKEKYRADTFQDTFIISEISVK